MCNSSHYMKHLIIIGGIIFLLATSITLFIIYAIKIRNETTNTWISKNETIFFTHILYTDCYSYKQCVFSNNSHPYNCNKINGVDITKLKPTSMCTIPKQIIPQQECNIFIARCSNYTTQYGYYYDNMLTMSTRTISHLCISNIFCEKSVSDHLIDYIRTIYYRINDPTVYYLQKGEYNFHSFVGYLISGMIILFFGLLAVSLYLEYMCCKNITTIVI